VIQSTFEKNYRKYWYPRITLKLRKLGYRVNKKKVHRLIVINLYAMPKRRMYKSYRGTVGKIADNLLNQTFTTSRPYQKLGTDITKSSRHLVNSISHPSLTFTPAKYSPMIYPLIPI
jgi:putative transposase